LLVEDEEHIRLPLRDLLEREGYAVVAVATASKARARIEAVAPALIILDWMLPDGQGIDLLTEWRRRGIRAPVIMLSARVELLDKVLGLELGADDYVTKPFEARELVSRVRARLRRARQALAAAEEQQIVIGDVALVPSTREVRLRGQPVALTRMEFALLKLLLESPGRVFTREELLNRVWGYESTPTTRTVDTHVLQLRAKLGSDLIESVRGVGYRVRVPVRDLTEN
jgi:DNA-binding response OmpR family regulator